MNNINKLFKKICGVIFIFIVLIAPFSARADSEILDNLKFVGEEGQTAPWTATDQYSLADIISYVISAFLGLLGMIFLILIIYAGYNWMIAQGDEEKVTKAKDTLSRAVIGLIITVGAYAISYFIFEKIIFEPGILK